MAISQLRRSLLRELEGSGRVIPTRNHFLSDPWGELFPRHGGPKPIFLLWIFGKGYFPWRTEMLTDPIAIRERRGSTHRPEGRESSRKTPRLRQKPETGASWRPRILRFR